MKLPTPAGGYDVIDQSQTRLILEQTDLQNVKKNQDNSNVILTNPRIVLVSPNGSKYILGVDNSGNLTTTAL